MLFSSKKSVPLVLLGLTLACSLVVLAACGDDDGPTTPAGPRQISGQVTKGSVSDASVSLHEAGADGRPGARVAGPFMTDATGTWAGEVAVGTSGPFVIVATGGSYTDEVSGATVDLGSAELWGFTSDGSGQVTPFTHALASAAGERIQTDGSVAAAWASVLASFRTAFGFDPTVTVPDASGSTDARTYLAMLGGISELLDDSPALSALDAAAAIDLVLALASDLSNGVLDGLDAEGNTIDVIVGTGTVTWPALDGTGIGALVDAINAYAAATSGLEGIVLSDVDLDFGDPTSGEGSGSVMFSGPGAQLLAQTTFVPAGFSANEQALAWSTGLVTFFAQVGVARSITDPTRASLVTVNTVTEGGVSYGWSVFSVETFVPGVTIDGNSVNFDDVILQGIAGTETTLIVSGDLGE